MNIDNSNITPRMNQIGLTDTETHTMSDHLVRLWLGGAIVGTALLVWDANLFTIALTSVSVTLATIWWLLSHVR